MQQIRAILFDLDDTLLDRRETFRRYCLRLTANLFPSLSAEARNEISLSMMEADQSGYRDRTEFFDWFVDRWSAPMAPGQLLADWHAQFGADAVAAGGLMPMLDSLHRTYRLGIVTNGASAMQNRKIDALGIRHHISCILISEEVGIRKPEPAIYLRACDALGATPQHTLFVGDNYALDVEGAERAGLNAVWVHSDSPDRRDCRTIASLAELPAMLHS